LDPVDVFAECVAGIADNAMQDRFLEARSTVQHRYVEFEIKTQHAQTFSIKSCRWGRDHQKIAIEATKRDFTDLYSTYFASEGSVGRKYYDAIKIRAPLGKCPYCRFGQVSTLDHFLAKSRYPALSVHPANLIPSCSDCNKGKGSPVVKQGTLGLHPYFESADIENDIWLYASVNHTSPLSITYNINPPAKWDDNQKERLNNHFKDFKLASRFAVEAATELAGLIDTLDDLLVLQDRIDHLANVARVERSKRPNTWKAALYDVLRQDLVYVNGAYRLVATE
jgi:5-methylcytosine-specific restriction endonuclease McrA